MDVSASRYDRSYTGPLKAVLLNWAGLRACTRNVGIPMAVGVILIADGRATGKGVLIAERVFEPADVFAELAKREIHIHEKVTELGA